MDRVKKCAAGVRAAFDTGRTRVLEYRIQQLRALKKMMCEREADFTEALYKDLKKNPFECLAFEISHTVHEVDCAIEKLPEWAAPEHVPKTPATQRNEAYVLRQPYGACLLIGAWNYPFNLTLHPLIGIIAAGNTCLIKPSEISPHTAEALAKFIPLYLDKEAYQVALGGVEETTEILKCRFDYIMYTGSTGVGKIVMRAAAEHLTPVTLELGGKNPCYVDKDCDLEFACRRIAWGKFLNSGQTCIAPDYLLCEPSAQPKIVECLKKCLKEFYGDNPQRSDDFGRMVTQRHYDRVMALLEGQKAACGGHGDRGDRYIAPTIIADADPKSKVMQDEIFGPVLPIVCVKSLQGAICFINERPKPLALYMFSDKKKDIEKMIAETCSGGVAVNDVIMHAIGNLPFGGCGDSGMGHYHDVYSFRNFSHARACLVRPMGDDPASAHRYPPANPKKMEFFRSAVACKK